MQMRREGRLRNSDIATGNILSLELETSDIRKLADPDQHYTMARFQQFRHTRLGWAMEDKVHIWLKEPRPDQDPSLPANLSLDPGGDLYFTIWKRDDLADVSGCEVFAGLSEFVQSDPSEVLNRLGIEVVRIYGMHMLARQIQDPDFL